MATDDAECGESGYYANVVGLRPSFLAREKLLSEEELQKLEASEHTVCFREQPSLRKRIEDIKERIYGNIDKLDYLRGISNLEKNFTNLMEQVLQTALTLSKTNCVSHPQHVFDARMDEKVEECWKYITQLTDAVQWHVIHASRYHKFHHDVQTANMELIKLTNTNKELINSLSPPSKLNGDTLYRVEREVESQINKLVELASKARQLNIQARAVAPLHFRKKLPPGRHSANLLASIRLPQGDRLHRGDPVHVWANNRVASDLLQEWAAETLDGKQTATLPAPCLWLTSPEASPLSSTREHASRITVHNGQCSDDESKARFEKQERSSNVKWKSKHTFDLFSNNKAIAAKFQKDLFSNWTDAIGDIAVCLLPTYQAYLSHLVDNTEDIPKTKMDDFSHLTSSLQPLVDYGDSEMQTLLNELKLKPVSKTSSESSFMQNELHQMVQTLNAWNKLRSRLLEAKQAATVRSMSQDAFNQALHDSQDKRFHSFDARHVSSLQESSSVRQEDVARIHSTDYEISQLDELVTSFADPAPRTFRVLENGSAEYVQVGQSPTIKVGTENVILPLKRTQSQPSATRQSIETKDLMTQINTPYLPTLVHCPKCDLKYEVDLYRSSTDLIHTSPGLETGPTDSLLCSPRAIYLTHRAKHALPGKLFKVRSAGSMPVLTGTQEPKYLTADSSLSSRSRTVEPNAKVRKRFGRLVKRRPHSFSMTTETSKTSGLNETTASSGIESLPDTPTQEKDKKKSKRGVVKKQTEQNGTKAPSISIFRWGKKRKTIAQPVSPGTESLVTEPGPPGRRSPLLMYQPMPLHVHTQLERPDSNTTLTDQDTPQPTLATPILRSRCWVQHGIPWGYDPPLHQRWQPSTEYIISQDKPQTHLMQSHSERLKNRTSRPRLGNERFFAAVESDQSFSADYSPTNQLMDSGMQTDTDLAPGFFDLDGTKKSHNFAYVFDPRKDLERRGSLMHSAIQCGSAFGQRSEVGVNVDFARPEHSSVECQAEIESLMPTLKRAQLWDVSCQVGLLQKSQGVFVDSNEILTKDFSIPIRSSVHQMVSQLQPEVSKMDSLVESSSFLKNSPLMFSVACQIGQIVQTTACGPDHLEAVQLLDESIGKFAKLSIKQREKMTQSSVCMKIGKKLQVGKPWWDETTVRISGDCKEAAVNTMEEAETHQQHIANIQGLRKAAAGIDHHAQTWISGEVIPCKRPLHDKSLQTPETQSDKQKCIQDPVIVECEYARTRETEQQMDKINVIPFMCATATCYVQPIRKLADVSTLVGRQMTAREQQTEISVTERSKYNETTGSNGLTDITQEIRSSVMPNLTSSQYQDNILADIKHQPNETAKTSFLRKLTPCAKCGFTAENASPVSMRSKRIQKGPPKLLSNVKHDHASIKGSAVGDYPIGIATQTRESRQRKTFQSHHAYEQPHVVLDIGFMGFTKCNSQACPQSNNCCIQTRLNTDTSSDKSTSSATTSETDDNGEQVCDRNNSCHSRHDRCVSMPGSSVRMCFHLDQSKDSNPYQVTARRWAPYSQQRKRGARSSSVGACGPSTQKSWSVDDLRTIEQQWDEITLEETGIQHACIPEREKRRLQVGNCPGLERGASGARRRIDQLKKQHEQYQYY